MNKEKFFLIARDVIMKQARMRSKTLKSKLNIESKVLFS